MNPEDVDELGQVFHQVKRLFLKRLADGRAHALDDLRGLIPARLTAARYRLTPSWIARDYPDREEIIHATYGRLLARDIVDWMVRTGECMLRNDGGIDMVRLAQKKAAQAAGKGKRAAADEGKTAKTSRGKRKPSTTARGSRQPAGHKPADMDSLIDFDYSEYFPE